MKNTTDDGSWYCVHFHYQTLLADAVKVLLDLLILSSSSGTMERLYWYLDTWEKCKQRLWLSPWWLQVKLQWRERQACTQGLVLVFGIHSVNELDVLHD